MRVTTSKSKNSESFYVTMSYINDQGKSTSKIYRKLGTLEELTKKLNTDRDGVLAWANQQAALDTVEYQKKNERVMISYSPVARITKDQRRLFSGGYLFCQSLYYQLKVDNICRNISRRHAFEYNLDAILSDLVYTRILEPASKRASYKSAQSFLEPVNYKQHDIYRALSVLAQESDYIQSEIYRNSNHVTKRNAGVLYYDCTNYYFEIEQEDGMKKYGKSKENRPNPIVQMGLFMDADGIPIAFDLFDGNQNEQPTLKPLEQKIIRDFDLSKFVVCTDAGLASKANRKFNSIGNRAFITTQSIKKLKAQDKELALKPTQWRLLGSNKFINLADIDDSVDALYYKEIPLDTNDLNQRLIVTFSPKYKKYQQKIRKQQIERALSMIEQGERVKNRKNPNDPARFITKHSITNNGEVAQKTLYSLDESAIAYEATFDGFYAVCTNLEDDVSHILNISEQRWKIEECFRITKSEFEARPVHLTREDRIKAHFLVCFLALLVYRLLEKKLNHKYTVSEILDTLRNFKFFKEDGYGYIPTYTRTDLTDVLHSVFGFITDYEFISKRKMREIIQKTK